MYNVSLSENVVFYPIFSFCKNILAILLLPLMEQVLQNYKNVSLKPLSGSFICQNLVQFNAQL